MRALAGWTEGVLWLVAVVQVGVLWFAVQQRLALDDIGQFPSLFELNDLIDAEDTWSSLLGLGFVGVIAALVLVIVWLYRVHGQVSSLGATGIRLPRGFTIGAWFIPLANVVLVTLMLSDYDRSARANGLPIGSAWKQRRTPLVVWLWLVSSIAFYIGSGNGTFDDESLGLSRSDLDMLVNWRITWAFASFTAAIALALYVRRVRGNLDAAAALAEPDRPAITEPTW